MILVIDNYDSFVFNLVQYIEDIGYKTEVVRNDEITVSDICSLDPEALFISPGPCTPGEAGISVPLVREMAGKIPIFGVCLGHQAIAQAFGARIKRADRVMHGKRSRIYHDGITIFRDVENPFPATRYHSLIVEKQTLPVCLEISAWTEDGLIMGIRHRDYMIEGVQFHPESILTSRGREILSNFLNDISSYKVNRKRTLAENGTSL